MVTKLERIANLERDLSAGDADIEKRIERAYQMEVLYLHPPRRNPINVALAYRRPFPEWTSEKFVKLVGADPDGRHPYAACKGFQQLIPFETFYRVRTETQFLADAERWRDELAASGYADLAASFWRILTFSEADYGALLSRI